jgi:hypothetical protein
MVHLSYQCCHLRRLGNKTQNFINVATFSVIKSREYQEKICHFPHDICGFPGGDYEDHCVLDYQT